MGQRETIIEGVARFKKRLSRETDVERVIFFGSRASGKPTRWSDVDLLIVSTTFRGVKNRRAKGLHKYWTLDYPVDFLCYTPAEFERLRKRVSLVREAVEKGIAV